MSENEKESKRPIAVDRRRRQVLCATGGGIIASAFGGLLTTAAQDARAQGAPVVRWGIVGTGSIANWMASAIQSTPLAELAAVSSRKMESANAFANKHGAGRGFDSWVEMASWDGVDAIYVATPTSVKEEICVVAANQGKHVLGEKPFASLASLQQITGACRENGVGFMDGTHFVHHP